MTHRLRGCLSAFIMVFMLCSCAHLGFFTGAKPPAEEPQAAHPQPVKPAAIPKPETPQAVINHYNAQTDKATRDQLTADFVKKMEGFKASADRAAENGDFAAAGKTYLAMLNHHDGLKTVAHQLSFDREELESSFAKAKLALYQRGFQEYRAGKLNAAIALWQDYLALDPVNEDIRRVLDTARTQQKSLR